MEGWQNGLAGVIFTCHCPLPNEHSSRVRMDPEQLDEYVLLVNDGAQFAPEGFEVRLGMESDYYPGMESWLEKLHQSADFEYILGSVHWHLAEYLEDFFEGDIDDFRRQYFEHLAESAETGLFDCLAHPDLIKNAEPGGWDFDAFQEDIAFALDRIAKTGVAMEINTSGVHKITPEMNPGPEMLAMIAQRDIPIVIGSDSHIPQRVGEGFHDALDMLETAGFKKVSNFKNRERYDLNIADVRQSMIENAKPATEK